MTTHACLTPSRKDAKGLLLWHIIFQSIHHTGNAILNPFLVHLISLATLRLGVRYQHKRYEIGKSFYADSSLAPANSGRLSLLFFGGALAVE